jgi:LPXTG-site transpeptidase (sortase) family protein
MVNFPKSNWLKYSIFLLPITLLTGSLSSPTTAAKTETFNKIENTQTLVSSPKNSVAEQAAQIVVATTAKEVVPPSASNFASTSGLALKIDAINLNIPLSTTTLGKNRELLVPANANVAAWYKNGPKIGEKGTALITGHLDQAGQQPGVFYNLRKLKTGDEISVRLTDGRVATYTVEKSESYAQDATFPWSKVYSTSGSSGIRIITCDGTFSPKTGRYSRNLVVYASLSSIE